MSDITATMLQDKLNSIERNAYDGIDFSQEVTAAYVLADELGERIDQFKAENTKLRELVADMWRFTGTACKKYPRLFDPAAQGGQMVQPNMLDSFEQRMCELGIEVEE